MRSQNQTMKSLLITMTISVVMVVTYCNCKTQNIYGALYFVCHKSKILDLPQKQFFLLRLVIKASCVDMCCLNYKLNSESTNQVKYQLLIWKCNYVIINNTLLLIHHLRAHIRPNNQGRRKFPPSYIYCFFGSLVYTQIKVLLQETEVLDI